MIYLDSCVAIYLVEYDPVFGPIARRALECCDEQVAVSPLVHLECLVKPYKQLDVSLEADYRCFLGGLVGLPVLAEDFERAAHIRADHGLRTPDALHLAIAGRAGCTALWTNDDRFAKAAPGYAVNIGSFSR